MKKTGSCHCGQVRFEIETKIESVISCNCSICQRKGSLLTFVPLSQFTLLSGEEAIKDYQFGKKSVHHYFCTNCGVSPFGAGKTPDGTDIRAVNVRCLDEIDLSTLSINPVDGKNF